MWHSKSRHSVQMGADGLDVLSSALYLAHSVEALVNPYNPDAEREKFKQDSQSLATRAPYGYVKDSSNSKRIIPDKATAPIVKQIFEWCAGGLGPAQIAKRLELQEVMTPSVYEYHRSGTAYSQLNLDKPYHWTSDTVAKLLEREDYIGNTVNCKTYRKSFIFKKLYEDRVAEKLTEERFEMLSKDYEAEQATLTARTAQMEQEITSHTEKAVNLERFLKIVDKCTDIMVLTPEILREFIERIEVHERSVYRGKDATQQIDIYYNFIGLMP